MIVICPACAVRIRLDRQRLGGKRITLRCARCRTAFKAEIPAAASDGPGIRIAVGHGDPVLCETIRDLVIAEGMDCQVCHDADGILRQMEEVPPHVAIIDAAIPGMYIFEVVSQIRSRPELAGSRIVLVSSVYNRAAYKRTPTSLYGADDYIEKHHLPDDLVPKIYALTAHAVPVRRASPREEVIAGWAAPKEEEKRAVQVQCEALNSRILAAEQADAAMGEAVEKADRLARIIVADIALYSQEKVEEGIRKGTLFALLAKEIEEGRRLFSERVAPEVRSQRDFLQEAFSDYIQRRCGEIDFELRGYRP